MQIFLGCSVRTNEISSCISSREFMEFTYKAICTRNANDMGFVGIYTMKQTA